MACEYLSLGFSDDSDQMDKPLPKFDSKLQASCVCVNERVIWNTVRHKILSPEEILCREVFRILPKISEKKFRGVAEK